MARKKKTRKTRSDKKKRYAKCKRKKATYEGVTVVLPCRTTKLTAKHKAAIDDEYTAADWSACKRVNKAKKGSCRVVFFSSGAPVMRRSDKKLMTPAKKSTARRRAKAQCRFPKNAARTKRGRFRAC